MSALLDHDRESPETPEILGGDGVVSSAESPGGGAQGQQIVYYNNWKLATSTNGEGIGVAETSAEYQHSSFASSNPSVASAEGDGPVTMVIGRDGAKPAAVQQTELRVDNFDGQDSMEETQMVFLRHEDGVPEDDLISPSIEVEKRAAEEEITRHVSAAMARDDAAADAGVAAGAHGVGPSDSLAQEQMHMRMEIERRTRYAFARPHFCTEVQGLNRLWWCTGSFCS